MYICHSDLSCYVSDCTVSDMACTSVTVIYHAMSTVRKADLTITVKPAHAVTHIKRAPFSCPVIENFI